MINIINRLLAMFYKEFIYVIRDTKMRIIIIAVPIIQSLVLGYAVNMDLKYVKTAVVDFDNTEESKSLLSKFFSTDTFEKVAQTNMKEAEDMVLSGQATMIIRIPKGFEANLSRGKDSHIQVIIDATNSVSAGMAAGYVSSVLELFNNDYISKITSENKNIGVVVDFRTWFNDNFESRNFFVPSILAMLIIIISVMLSGMAIVQEKETGTMEQLIVSPITAGEFIAGKCFPFAIVSFIDVILIISIAVFWFKIPVTGSLLLLLISSMLYIFATLGVGLLISAISSTQQQAMMSTFMVIFPMILLSGFAFPIENMPKVIQYITYINPVRYFLVIIRGVFLKGLYFDSLKIETIILAIQSLCYLSIAVILLRKRLN